MTERQHQPTTPYEVLANRSTEIRQHHQDAVEKARANLERELDQLRVAEEMEQHFQEMLQR